MCMYIYLYIDVYMLIMKGKRHTNHYMYSIRITTYCSFYLTVSKKHVFQISKTNTHNNNNNNSNNNNNNNKRTENKGGRLTKHVQTKNKTGKRDVKSGGTGGRHMFKLIIILEKGM